MSLVILSLSCPCTVQGPSTAEINSVYFFGIKDLFIPFAFVPRYDKASALDRVQREARILAKLKHENIVRYHVSWLEEPPALERDAYLKNEAYECSSLLLIVVVDSFSYSF
jgi:serine/threonine protein kinase